MGDYRGDLLFSARLTGSIGRAQANKMWELRVYLGRVGVSTPRNSCPFGVEHTSKMCK